MTAMTLAQAVAVLPGASLEGDASLSVMGVTADSQQATAGVIFVAVAGTKGDGHQYIESAIAQGAVAVAVNTSYRSDHSHDVAVIRCPDTRPVPALLARALANDPDEKLWTTAVTGTNGKTTTAFLIQEMLNQLHGPCGLLGTIRYDDGRQQSVAPLTTPGGPVFYDLLGKMVGNGCRSVTMELSSHALDQQRTAGLGLDVALITNLGRDHLDYHPDMASYLAAKAKIRELLRVESGCGGTGRPGTFVVNIGDEALRGLAQKSASVLRFCADPCQELEADLQVLEVELSLRGTYLKLKWQEAEISLESPLVGRFNVENLASAMAVGLALGLEGQMCAEALAGVEQVPGRLERFVLANGAVAVVDYAHTHDALAAVLDTCSELTAGRMLVVFGCGGDRDRGKRALMAEVAATLSDAVWITSDNPRNEDPAAICQEIWQGFEAVKKPRAKFCEIEVDRKLAIEKALAAALPKDVVIVAGKGHEDYQLVGDQVLDLDDRQIVREWVASA